MLTHPVKLPHLTVPGALALARELLAAGEPIEKRPAFLFAALVQLDDAARGLRGAMQYRNQLQRQHPTVQQRARADVEAQLALDQVKSAIRGYALRVSVVVDERVPATLELARTLIAPLVEWEQRDAKVLPLPHTAPQPSAEAAGATADQGAALRARRRLFAAA